MTIQSLINKVDNVELIRDTLAAILVVESASQQALAVVATLDPRLWALAVYLERSNPWSSYLDAPDQIDAPPIVNVSFDSTSFDRSGGNVFERQRGNMTFNVDVYGYGLAADDGADGHVAGDQAAALNCMRATRLVRNIIMASEYTYLGLQGLVGRRWINSVTTFVPPIDGKAAQQVIATRLAVEVLANEFAPQYEGEILELINVRVKREFDGAVMLIADFDETPDS